jgi:hypothetical protein
MDFNFGPNGHIGLHMAHISRGAGFEYCSMFFLSALDSNYVTSKFVTRSAKCQLMDHTLYVWIPIMYFLIRKRTEIKNMLIQLIAR